MNNKVQIIAEAGVNHNGSIDMAFKLIDIAQESGADIVKFQTSIPELTSTKYALKADYQLSHTDSSETMLEMANQLSLPLDDFRRLKIYSEKKGIKFLSTPFDIVSINYLNELGLDCFKVPSGEITNLPFLREIGRLNKKVIMSTGMAELSEVNDALEILISSGTDKDKITVLHCNTEYPTPYEDATLRAMLTIKDEFEVQIGYSDHTLGIEVPIAAVAMGASVIEKHFTLDRTLPGPDHCASLEPNELKSMVDAIRNIEKAIGDGLKQPSLSEQKNIPIARKSIVAKKVIKKGELFTEDNLAVKRPGTGISPMKWDVYIGKSAKRDYEEDELIDESV